jgi:hypothetical protein
MPNKAIMRAKQNRAASLGQSSRLYKIGNAGALVPGGQGFGSRNPSIGSFRTLQYVEQVRTSGGGGGASVKELDACIADATLVYNAITDYKNPNGKLSQLVESTNLSNSIKHLNDDVNSAKAFAGNIKISNWGAVKLTLKECGVSDDFATNITEIVNNIKEFDRVHLTNISTKTGVVNTNIGDIVKASENFKSFATDTLIGSNKNRITSTN